MTKKNKSYDDVGQSAHMGTGHQVKTTRRADKPPSWLSWQMAWCHWAPVNQVPSCWVQCDYGVIWIIARNSYCVRLFERMSESHPANKLRNEYIIITSKRRFDVIIMYLLRGLFTGQATHQFICRWRVRFLTTITLVLVNSWHHRRQDLMNTSRLWRGHSNCDVIGSRYPWPAVDLGHRSSPGGKIFVEFHPSETSVCL